MADINNFLALMLQLSVPIVLGALCGTIAERGGIILLGVEGLMLIGAFAGVVGSYLSLSQNNLFVTDMTAGRGFMGLAANIFGGWQPIGSLGAGMVFAVAQAARFYLTEFEIPSQIVQMLPYVITLLILLFVGKRVKGPEALGKLVD